MILTVFIQLQTQAMSCNEFFSPTKFSERELKTFDIKAILERKGIDTDFVGFEIIKRKNNNFDLNVIYQKTVVGKFKFMQDAGNGQGPYSVDATQGVGVHNEKFGRNFGGLGLGSLIYVVGARIAYDLTRQPLMMSTSSEGERKVWNGFVKRGYAIRADSSNGFEPEISFIDFQDGEYTYNGLPYLEADIFTRPELQPSLDFFTDKLVEVSPIDLVSRIQRLFN